MKQGAEQLVKQDYKRHLEDSFIEDFKDWNEYLSIVNDILSQQNDKQKKMTYNEFCGKLKDKFNNQINAINWSKILTIKNSQFMGILNSSDTSDEFQNSLIRNRLYQLEQKLIQSSVDSLISEISKSE